MAHHVEPMDIDSDFDNKENSLHHNNVLPFTEKGYEELDVSELNMKLRYSITPASSPMSKSYTANCIDNRSLEPGDDSLNVTVSENCNLTRSLNSTMTKTDSLVKSLKALPLQTLPTEFVDNNRTSVLRPLDSTIPDNANITVTVSRPNDIDDNVSLPSSSSSAVQTPEATTPTKDMQKAEAGSPIMRGLKSVLNMFRPSQSPIPAADKEDVNPDILSPAEGSGKTDDTKSEMLISTPIATHRKKEMSPTKRSSPNKDSIVFNDDLEKELQWKNETTILFKQERIPIHKLFFQQPVPENKGNVKEEEIRKPDENLDSTVEYMDISYNDSITDKTMTDLQKGSSTFAGESDSEFVDCETTFTKNESLIEDNDKTPVNDNTIDLDLTKNIENVNENTSASRLKQIILNTTQDILDATLSITPEDLISEVIDKTKDISGNTIILEHKEDQTTNVNKVNESTDSSVDKSSLSQENFSVPNQTIDNIIPVNVEVKEYPNVTRAIINDVQLVLDQTVNITHLVSNDQELNNTLIKENISNTVAKNISISAENLDSTSKSEPIVLDTKMIEDVVTRLSTDYSSDIIPPNMLGTQQDFSETQTLDHNSIIAENSETAIPSPVPLEKAIKKPLLLNDIVETSLIKEASMTELPVDIPLPDEDDLEKEFNDPVNATHEFFTASNNLPLDLVGGITVKPETEVLRNMPSEEMKLEESVFNDDKIVFPEILQPLNTPKNVDIIQNQAETLDVKVLKANQDVADSTEAKQEKLQQNEEPQNINIEVLPESLSTLNIEVVNENEVELEKVHDEVKAVNKTSIEQNLIQNQSLLSMDINASVMETNPLPDVINQMGMLPNVENLTSEQIITSVTENPIADQSVCSDVTSTTRNKPVDDLLWDVKVSEIVDSSNVIEEPLSSVIYDTNNLVPENINEGELNKIYVNLTEDNISLNEMQPSGTDTLTGEGADIKTSDEEIIVSENNSPFVSVITANISKELPKSDGEIELKVEDHEFEVCKDTYSPPSSPPIASKGYNFNFDEIDDPFATKTKIRLSPPLDSLDKTVELCTSKSKSFEDHNISKKEFNNSLKSQSERKMPVAPKRKFNSTFGGARSEKIFDKSVAELAAGDIKLDSPANVALDPSNVTIEEDKIIYEANLVHEETLNLTKALKSELETKQEDDIEQPIETRANLSESVITNVSEEVKTTSSSDQSIVYYSAHTSSSDSLPSKNVFNLPEIDDINFNPFASKSKIRQSPPPSEHIDNNFASNCKSRSSPESSINVPQNDDQFKVQDTTRTIDDKIEFELMEKNASVNLSNTSISSKATDERNATTREVNTEDEDTIEGPFLETEDLNPDDKMSDIDGNNIDMMQFHDIPVQGNEENLDNGELFIDAEAFEFLLNQNKCNTVVDSGKESLFLKFDPLFAKRMSAVTSDGVVASLSKIQKRQSTPTKVVRSPQKEVISLTHPITKTDPNLNVTQDIDINTSAEFNDDLNITVSKPMMAVPPAVNPVTPRNKSLTPNRSNRRSITFTSPAMAVIDRLLSLSGNSSLVHDTTVTHATREHNETDLALTQLRELLAEKEIHVYSLRMENKELKDRLTTLESHLKSLEEESQDRLKKINDLNEKLAEKTKTNKSMAAVVEEYERTIASLIAESAQDKKRQEEERIKLINERDEQTAHLASMEVSFSDLHSKYEKSKQVILNCKANEDVYKKSIKEFEDNLIKMQNNYELLKQHATSKLNHANLELEKMNRSHEAEVLKLNAMIKRKELHITSLEESYAQKTKANEELTAICDELINKVG